MMARRKTRIEMSTRELRYIATQELRAAGTAKNPKIEGYASVFGQVADIGSFKEVVQAGAFSRTLKSSTEVVMLFNHDDSLLLGRRSAGNLSIEEDSIGLKFSCELANTSVAKDVYENLKAGNLRECSFGFCVDEPSGEQWTKLADGSMLRTLVSVKLFDVSVVSFPAYSGTSAVARNIVPADLEQRMTRALGTDNAGGLIPSGGPVPFQKHDKRSEDPFDSVDEANGFINWAAEDEDRAAGDRKINVAKARQGFAYVKGDGSKRSDYLLPHHTIIDGQIAHSFMGALSALGDLATPSKVDIPTEHHAEVRSHLLNEMDVFNDDSDQETEIERSRARIRIALAK
jgi:HK97 family phage prohead protease